jgi:uncharacterized membrane protein
VHPHGTSFTVDGARGRQNLPKYLLQPLNVLVKPLVFPLPRSYNTPNLQLNHVWFIGSLVYLNDLGEGKNVRMESSTHTIQFMMQSFHCVSCSRSVIVKVIPVAKIAFNLSLSHLNTLGLQIILILLVFQGLELCLSWPAVFRSVKDECGSATMQTQEEMQFR